MSPCFLTWVEVTQIHIISNNLLYILLHKLYLNLFIFKPRSSILSYILYLDLARTKEGMFKLPHSV